MVSPKTSDQRRLIPSVDKLLADPKIRDLIALYGREQVRVQVREELVELRRHIDREDRETSTVQSSLENLGERIRQRLEQHLSRPIRRVLNATGILLHTNLGRAPLPADTAASLAAGLDAYCDLEIDLASGRRGNRNHRAEKLLTALTGAESAVVVNNNAAALVLALATLASDRSAIVSRGELVEIGGSFRIPEIMEAAGARLVEVGATNRTRINDYERAISDSTGLILKVFPSNYLISGFISSVAPEELAQLGRRQGIPVLVDEGSGLLRPHSSPQLAPHPSMQTLIAADCDLVCGSGDKLLGGPQAGLLVGRRDLVEKCRRHPLYRAFRPDRATFLSLEGVLRRHLTGAPFPLDQLWPDAEQHQNRLTKAAARIGAEIIDADAFVGGGSAPEVPIPGPALSLPGNNDLLRQLRLGKPSVVGYLRKGRLILDLRTVAPEDDEALLDAVHQCTREI